jgi:ABC-2 type transport system ATP-binding protein
MSIQVQQLVKQYGTQKAVNNISFNIGKGEIVGFLGPNGAGKSTTMKIITGYLQADAGNATVCGINVKDNPIAVKQKIGYLPEANPLYYDMYVKEYLYFIAGVHRVANPKQAVSQVIELTGLQVEQHKKTGQLSKGYKQRVGLAAALIHNPDVLILDEPTSGLDPNQIVEIREVIRRQGQNKTVLFSSHILQEVEAICDRVIIINRGNLVADDSLVNLQAKGRQSATVTIQFEQLPNIGLLQQLQYVTGVNSLPNNSFVLQTQQPDAVRKQVLQLALQHNLNIVSLQAGGASLEEVFRSLTAK